MNTDSVNIGVLAVGISNQPPVANAGLNFNVGVSTNVILDGSASSDPDGTIAAYAWRQIAGDTVVLAGADTAMLSFTAPSSAGDLDFELTVTDDDGATATAQVRIVVTLANQAPIANAGSNQTNIAAGATVTLDGSASSDPDGTIASYAWSQTSGTTVVLSNTTIAGPTFTAPSTLNAQNLQFRLIVTDNNGATHSDTVDIGVNARPPRGPRANAGSDQFKSFT